MMLNFYLIIFIISIILTLLVYIIAKKKNLIDKPNERSSHSIPTPRAGGIAIVITWFGGLFFLHRINYIENNLFLALCSGIFIAIISLIDDFVDLKPIVRLIFQGISTLGALYFLSGFQNFPLSDINLIYWAVNMLIFFAVIWFINLYNFLDGIDGYASQEAILVGLGLFLLSENYVLGLLIFSVAGFLVYNWPRAKIFMGDVGSTQLGFILIVLGIYFHNSIDLNIGYWLILTSIFWFDGTYTLFRRYKNKEKLSHAHKKHAYQRLVQGGYSHLKVLIYSILINAVLIIIVLLSYLYQISPIIVLMVVILGNLVLHRMIERIFPFSIN